jgi:hypothetical protein
MLLCLDIDRFNLGKVHRGWIFGLIPLPNLRPVSIKAIQEIFSAQTLNSSSLVQSKLNWSFHQLQHTMSRAPRTVKKKSVEPIMIATNSGSSGKVSRITPIDTGLRFRIGVSSIQPQCGFFFLAWYGTEIQPQSQLEIPWYFPNLEPKITNRNEKKFVIK